MDNLSNITALGNLTAIIIQTQPQNKLDAISQAAIPSIITAAAAIISIIVTNYFNQETNKRQNAFSINQERERGASNTKQKQQQTYSQLMGRRKNILAAYKVYFDKLVGYNEQKIKLLISKFDYLINDGYSKEEATQKVESSPDYKEYLETEREWEELRLELAGISERTWESIGRVQILLPRTPKLEKIISQVQKAIEDLEVYDNKLIENYDSLYEKVRVSPKYKDIEASESWKSEKTKELVTFSNTAVRDIKTSIKSLESNMDELLEHIRNEIQ